MGKESSGSSNWTRYTKEFSWGVWLVVGGAVVVLTAMIYLVTEFSPTQTQTLTLAEAVTQVIGAFTSQSSTIQFTSFSSRWTIFVVFAFSLLINIFYSSWLYAMLAVKITVYPFSGFQSILEDKSYTLGVVDGFSIKTELEMSEDAFWQRVWQELNMENGVVSSMEEGLQKTQKERFIMLLSKRIFYGSCNSKSYTVLQGLYFQRNAGFAVRKDSPFHDVLNRGMLKMHETGLVQKAFKVRMESEGHEEVTSITLEQTSSLFVMLITLTVASTLILICEKLCRDGCIVSRA